MSEKHPATSSLFGTTEPPDGVARQVAEYQHAFLRVVSVIGTKDGALAWLDESVSILAGDLRGDVTKNAPKSVRQQCFYTREDGTIQYLEEWVTGPIREDVEAAEARGEIPKLPLQSFVHFNMRLMALDHFMHEKQVTVPYPEGPREEKVIEVGPVMRCVAAYNRELRKGGRRGLSERPIPRKDEAFRDLAAHLGLISARMAPDDLRRRLQKARARLK